MWKLFFTYEDHGKCVITNKGKTISKEEAVKYYKQYGIHSDGGIYQEYPKKDHDAVLLKEMLVKMGADDLFEEDTKILKVENVCLQLLHNFLMRG